MTSSDGVFISSQQVYEEVRTLAATVTRMDAKLDGLTDRLLARETLLQDHESRLRALERKVWVASGCAGAAGTAAGWIVGML